MKVVNCPCGVRIEGQSDQEVVVRVKELLVDPGAAMVAKVESLLGPGSILVEYAGRA